MSAISSPAALARISNSGSIGGSKSGRLRVTPSMFWQWRILNSRSSTVSHSSSNRSFAGTQKYVEPTDDNGSSARGEELPPMVFHESAKVTHALENASILSHRRDRKS